MLEVPRGLGVVFWDTEELYAVGRERLAEARRQFQRVASCPPLMRVQFLPFALDLVADLLKRVTPR